MLIAWFESAVNKIAFSLPLLPSSRWSAMSFCIQHLVFSVTLSETDLVVAVAGFTVVVALAIFHRSVLFSNS